MGIDELFVQLESSIKNKGKSLFKGDGADSLQLLSRLRSAVAAKLNEADKLVSTKAAVLRSADDAARRIIEEANAKAEQKLSDSDYVKSAEKKAEEILKASIAKQNDIMHNFALYLDSKLSECEKLLTDMAEEIHNDRAKLFPT